MVKWRYTLIADFNSNVTFPGACIIGIAQLSKNLQSTLEGTYMKNKQMQRRQFLKLGGATLAMIPVIAASGRVDAATNPTMRTSLKYQDKPEGDKSCANCMQFVPGKTPTDLGGCKVMAGDTEISPKGYCMVWAKKA
jgi:hypothetical protein